MKKNFRKTDYNRILIDNLTVLLGIEEMNEIIGDDDSKGDTMDFDKRKTIL